MPEMPISTIPDIPAIVAQLAQLSARVTEHDTTIARPPSVKTLSSVPASLNYLPPLRPLPPRLLSPRLPRTCRPTPAASTPAVPKGTEASQWSTVAARKPKKASKGSGKSPLPQQATPKRREAIVRGFNETSGPVGYTTVYINRSRRFTKSEVRRNLRFLGIDPRRVIDISFPARNVIGLLIHLGFQAEFETLLASAKVATIQGFDPLHPDHVADPKYSALSLEERANVAGRLHHQRCLRSLQYLAQHRLTLFAPVAREFMHLGWVVEEDLRSIAPKNPLPLVMILWITLTTTPTSLIPPWKSINECSKCSS
ncbi:hypothetical protein BX666DRAFT_2100209 [Dichotomocladium elegans]|nr:hypothetical protein BX666DRAFT_2100209 [Dichotomocladium elegans]